MDKRHELKMAYKNRPKNMGIYQIKNNVNGKILIGSSVNLDGTINRLKFDLIHGGLGCQLDKELIKEWNAYGAENFSFEILDRLEPDQDKDPLRNYKDDLVALEELWLEKLEPYGEKGYNHRKIKPKDWL